MQKNKNELFKSFQNALLSCALSQGCLSVEPWKDGSQGLDF